MSDLSPDMELKTAEDEEQVADIPEFEPVCAELPRIYDSCGSKDCLRDINVYFSPEDTALVDAATSARATRASVISSTLAVDAMSFNRGYYSVDITYYIALSVEIFNGTSPTPSTVTGLAVYSKRVVLYGSDGNSKTFSSASATPEIDTSDFISSCPGSISTQPTATVNVSSPMVLATSLIPVTSPVIVPFVPENVLEFFGGELAAPSVQLITVTLGIFSIIRLSRRVQVMLPSYDFCYPVKECEDRTDDPCEAFSRIEFPTNSFFPPANPDTETPDKNPFGCNCN